MPRIRSVPVAANMKHWLKYFKVTYRNGMWAAFCERALMTFPNAERLVLIFFVSPSSVLLGDANVVHRSLPARSINVNFALS